MTDEKKIALPYLLNAIAKSHFTGTLSLVEGTVERVLFFHDGWSVHVQSRLQEETLGRILLDEKRITREQYERMLNDMVQTKKQSGEVLISMGVLTPQEVVSALEYQTLKKLINCLGMRDYHYHLETKPVPSKLHLSRRNPTEIIFAGVRAAYSVDRLLSEFPVDEETTFMAHQLPVDRAIQISQLETNILQTISTGITLTKLMVTHKELQVLLAALYTLHSLDLVEASGITRPIVPDQELLSTPREPTTVEIPIQVAPATAAQQAYPDQRQPLARDENAAPSTFGDMQLANAFDANLAAKALAATTQDHFSFLGVDRAADNHKLQTAYTGLLTTYRLQEINNAYKTDREREMARRLLNRANLAYKVLLDDNSRTLYLATLASQHDAGVEPASNRILADVEAQKGQRALSNKDYEEAIQSLEKAILLYQVDPSYHFQLGLAGYLKAANETPPDQPLPEILRKPFLEAIALNPRYDMPRLYLGYISKRNGNLTRALKEFESALECNHRCKQAAAEIHDLKNHPELAD